MILKDETLTNQQKQRMFIYVFHARKDDVIATMNQSSLYLEIIKPFSF